MSRGTRAWFATVLSVLAALFVHAAVVGVSGASFVAQAPSDGSQFVASALFGNDTFRVTTYQLGPGAFGGTRYTLTLANDLEYNYFAMVEGGAGANDGGTTRGPDENFVRVVADPFTPNFPSEPETTANQIVLERSGGAGDWQGTITIVESVQDHGVSGFRLRGVLEVGMGAGVTNASANLPSAWQDVGQVGVYAGVRGGGVISTSTQSGRHQSGWARVYPTGTDQVVFERQGAAGNSLNGTATFSAYVVEWGSEWTIQSVLVSGSNGGNGANQAGEYSLASITPVARANTFILANGRTAENGLGDGWEGQTFTLGNGVSQNAVENRVAVGAEFASARDAQLFVHTHPDLEVDYRFGADGGNPGIPSNALSGNATVDAASAAESYTGNATMAATIGQRFPMIASTSNGTGNAFPRPMVAARHTAGNRVTWQRSRSGQPGAFWLQSVDLAGIKR